MRIALNDKELEMVNGGIDWEKVFGFSWTSGMGIAAITSVAIAAMSGPVGWGALAIVGAAGAGRHSRPPGSLPAAVASP